MRYPCMIVSIWVTAANALNKPNGKCEWLTPTQNVSIQNNEVCDHKCVAVWNKGADNSTCQTWSDKAWWTGNACVARCEDVAGYSRNRNRCLDSRGKMLVLSKRITDYSYEIQSVPLYCECYDFFKLVTYTDQQTCNETMTILYVAQGFFICVGAALIALGLVLCISSQATQMKESLLLVIVGGVIIICSPHILATFISLIVLCLLTYCMCGNHDSGSA